MASSLIHQPEVCLLLLRLNRLQQEMADYGDGDGTPGVLVYVYPTYEKLTARLQRVVKKLGFTEDQANELVSALLQQNLLGGDPAAVRRSMSVGQALGDEPL